MVFASAALGICKHCIWSYVAAQQHKTELARLEHIDRLVALGLTTDQAKEALNTIDSGPPVSSVLGLPAQSGHAFLVQWPGHDYHFG